MKQPFVIMIMNWTVWKSPKKSRGNLGFWTEVMNLALPNAGRLIYLLNNFKKANFSKNERFCEKRTYSKPELFIGFLSVYTV